MRRQFSQYLIVTGFLVLSASTLIVVLSRSLDPSLVPVALDSDLFAADTSEQVEDHDDTTTIYSSHTGTGIGLKAYPTKASDTAFSLAAFNTNSIIDTLSDAGFMSSLTAGAPLTPAPFLSKRKTVGPGFIKSLKSTEPTTPISITTEITPETTTTPSPPPPSSPPPPPPYSPPPLPPSSPPPPPSPSPIDRSFNDLDLDTYTTYAEPIDTGFISFTSTSMESEADTTIPASTDYGGMADTDTYAVNTGFIPFSEDEELPASYSTIPESPFNANTNNDGAYPAITTPDTTENSYESGRKKISTKFNAFPTEMISDTDERDRTAELDSNPASSFRDSHENNHNLNNNGLNPNITCTSFISLTDLNQASSSNNNINVNSNTDYDNAIPSISEGDTMGIVPATTINSFNYHSSEEDSLYNPDPTLMAHYYASSREKETVNCVCGVLPESSNANSHRNEHPWSAVMFHRTYPDKKKRRRRVLHPTTQTMIMFCGATLINDRYVLTAARCVNGITASELEIWLSEDKIWSDTKPSKKLHKSDVEKIIMHPEFDRRILDHEIALLKLANPVPFSNSIKNNNNNDTKISPTSIVPACLPLPSWNPNSYLKSNATLTSWEKKGRTSYTMHKSYIPIMNDEECKKMMNKPSAPVKVNDNMLCAGDVQNGAPKTCETDTGSPLVVDDSNGNEGRQTVVGIASWLYGCTSEDELSILYNIIFNTDKEKPQSPGVYSRVERYYQFIMENTVDAQFCSG